ncbi:GNAT family N-acetyltransferase [Spirosoma aerophilum]
MIHPLDNPVWSALTSGNKSVALGNDQAKYYPPQVAPFVAVADNTRVHFEALLGTIPYKQPVALFTHEPQLDPSPWVLINRIDGVQMLYEGPTPAGQDNLIDLTEADVPQMLALTKLSPPGPFLPRTIELGGYQGIFASDQLVAMAGRRFDSGTHVEISAVCTHPDHTGKGYARRLLDSQIRHIRAEDKIPYLHVRTDNTRAFRIYEQMGFVTRAEMTIYLVAKP